MSTTLPVNARREDFLISTDPERLDIPEIHRFLTSSYWAKGIDEATVASALENSLNFGVYRQERQIGFARLVTDRATFAYLADVFIMEGSRGLGLSKWLMEVIADHPDVQGLRRWILATRDAHDLYRRYGFTELSAPARFMEKFDAEAYSRPRRVVG